MLLVMTPFGRGGGGIGNYLFHLCHCIMYARIREGTLLVPRPLAFRTMNDTAIALDFSRRPHRHDSPPIWWDGHTPEEVPRSYDPNQIEVIGSLLRGNEQTLALGFADRYRCMQEQVRPLFKADAPHRPLGDGTLAIHIRSGDIFEAEPNFKYGQPPLSWYETLIERGGFDDVVIVTQNNIHHGAENPVIAEIRKRWPHIEFVSEYTEHDFHTLRHARHLALSSSTFATAAAMLNTRLQTLHVPEWDRAHDINITGAFPRGVRLGFTRFGYRIGNYQAMRSWDNSPAQRSLMLQHSSDDIELSVEHPADPRLLILGSPAEPGGDRGERGTAPPAKPFEKLQVLGPFNSGTRLMFNYQQAQFEAEADYHTCFWKHSIPPRYREAVDRRTEQILTPSDELFESTLFICMLRLPYFWLLATLRKSYREMRFRDAGIDVGSRLRSPVEFEGRTYPNLTCLWNAYYRAYLEHLVGRRASVRFVRLEDLVQRPQGVLLGLRDFLRPRPGADLEETIRMISNKPAKIHGGPCVYGDEAERLYVPENVPRYLSWADIEYIDQHLDHGLMEAFGYPLLSRSRKTA